MGKPGGNILMFGHRRLWEIQNKTEILKSLNKSYAMFESIEKIRRLRKKCNAKRRRFNMGGEKQLKKSKKVRKGKTNSIENRTKKIRNFINKLCGTLQNSGTKKTQKTNRGRVKKMRMIKGPGGAHFDGECSGG